MATTTTAQKRKDTVDTPSIAYSKMAKKWPLIDDLLGGTEAMQARGQTRLPKPEKESIKDYNWRKKHSILYNKFKRTRESLAARPFAKPLTFTGDLPENLEDVTDNVDLSGTAMTPFAYNMFLKGLDRGVYHVLVDMPKEGVGLTRLQWRQREIRPYWTLYSAKEITGFKFKRQFNGKTVPTQIRVQENSVEDDGAYAEKQVRQYRVYNAPYVTEKTPEAQAVLTKFESGEIGWKEFANTGGTLGTWELWRKEQEDSEYARAENGIGNHTYPGIPLHTGYFMRTGFMTGDPVLEELAWMNLWHYQSSSLQRNVTNIGRIPFLEGKGLPRDMKIKISTAAAVPVPTDGGIQWVELTGKGAEIGFRDLEACEARMDFLSLEPLMRKTGQPTATGRALDESKFQSDIERYAREIERSCEACMKISARWTGDEIPKDYSVSVAENNLSLSLRATEDLKALEFARARNDITHKTYLNELKRRAVLAESVDVNTEITEAALNKPEFDTFEDVNEEEEMNNVPNELEMVNA